MSEWPGIKGQRATAEHNVTVTQEQWKRALTAGPPPPLSLKRRIGRKLDATRYRLASWISPYEL